MGMKRQKRRKARIKKFKARVKAAKQKKSEGGGDGGGGKKKSPTNRRNNNNTGQQKQVKAITRNMSMRQKARIRNENFKATGVQTHGGTKKNYSRAEARKIEKAFGRGSFSKVTGLSESKNPLGDRTTKFETPAQYEQSLNPDSFKGLSDGVTSGVGPVASGDAYARGLNVDNKNVENIGRSILNKIPGVNLRKLTDKEIADSRQRMQFRRAKMIADRRRRARGTNRTQQQFEGFGPLFQTMGGLMTPGSIDTSNMPSGNSNFEIPPGLQDNIPVTNDSTRAAQRERLLRHLGDRGEDILRDRGKPSLEVIRRNRLRQLGIQEDSPLGQSMLQGIDSDTPGFYDYNPKTGTYYGDTRRPGPKALQQLGIGGLIGGTAGAFGGGTAGTFGGGRPPAVLPGDKDGIPNNILIKDPPPGSGGIFSGLIGGLMGGAGVFGSGMQQPKLKVGDDRGQKRLNLFIDGRRSEKGNMFARSGRRIRGISGKLTNLNI